MNPEDDTYRAFVEAVAEAIESVADEHDVDAEVSVEEGKLTTIAVRGELDGERPIELITQLSADIQENTPTSRESAGYNESVTVPSSGEMLTDTSISELIDGSETRGGRRKMEPTVELGERVLVTDAQELEMVADRLQEERQ